MDHAATVADLRESAGAGRGEALALRWRGVDLDAGRLQVRRSLGVAGPRAPASSSSRDRRTGRARVVNIDAHTVAALLVHHATRGSLMHEPVRDAALVPGDLGGTHRYPERYARRFAGQVGQVRTALGEERLPVIRLHDLRRTHATLLPADGVR